MQQFALQTNLMTNCQLAMTDNITSAPSVGLSAITQEDKSVVSAQKEKTRGGEINICKNLCKHCLLTTEKLWTPHVHPSASHSIKTSAVIISSQQSRGAIYQAASEQSELEVHVSKAEKSGRAQVCGFYDDGQTVTVMQPQSPMMTSVH